jgi:hypothetical protein
LTLHARPPAQTLDVYVPAGDTGFWQGAVREPDDPFRECLHGLSLRLWVMSIA